MSDDHGDGWDRAGPTFDWAAGLIAARVGREPAELVVPTVGVGLAAGLAAEALKWATGVPVSLVLVGVSLTVSGFGMLGLVARRMRRGSGGATTAGLEVLAPWLRRLQLFLGVALVAVVGLLVAGAVLGSWVLVVRNTLEIGRVGAVVVAISFLLMDDEVGLPDWLAAREPLPLTQLAPTERGQ